MTEYTFCISHMILLHNKGTLTPQKVNDLYSSKILFRNFVTKKVFEPPDLPRCFIIMETFWVHLILEPLTTPKMNFLYF